MKAKAIGAVVVLLIVAAAVYTATHKSKKSISTVDIQLNTTKPGANTNTTAKSKTNDTKASGTLNSLLTSGSPKHCSISDSLGGTSSSGDVYTDGNGSSHSTYSVKSNGTTLMSNEIIKNNTAYFWISTGSGSVGYSIDLNDKNINAKALANAGAIDPSQTLDMTCKSWSPASGEFDVPSNITFTDFSALYNSSAGQ